MKEKGRRKHVLIIGGMKASRRQAIAEGCRVTWFIEQNKIIDFGDNPDYQQILIFNREGGVDQLVPIARTLHELDPFDTIWSFHDETQPVAIAVAEALGLPFAYTRETLEKTRNKYQMRAFLEGKGIAQIKFALVESVSGVGEFFARNPTIEKAVLKPVDGTGSRNVVALRRQDIDGLAENAALEFPLIIEEFVDGSEYSVEAFTHNGRHYVAAVTEKFKQANTFMENGHLVPARISDSLKRRIAAYVRKCLTALNISCGPSHTEVIVHGAGVTLVETHTRVGGDCIPELVEYATGIDLNKLAALQAIGKDFPIARLKQQRNSAHACIRFRVQQESRDVISGITGVEEVEKWPEVKKVSVEYQVGQKLPAVKHSFDRAAFVLVVEQEAEQALSKAAQALDEIVFKFDSKGAK